MNTATSVFFSIIVPIYNVERYLNTCIQSVLAQTYKGYELILVDDGSPDGCGSICDRYAQSNPQIRVLHKTNGGLSSARNAGLDIAQGRYVIFLDSDDFWDDKEALKNIHAHLSETDADLLIFPAKRYYETTDTHTLIVPRPIDRAQIINPDKAAAVRYMLETNVYRAAAWNKVVRRTVIEQHAMRFKEGYLSEDMDWCGDLLLHCARFDYYANPFYCYRQQRSGSITHGKKEKLVADKLYMVEKGYAQASTLNLTEKELLASYYAYEYSVLIGVSSGIRNPELIRRMKANQDILRYSVCNKVKKVAMLKHVLGFDLTRLALCFFVRVKR